MFEKIEKEIETECSLCEFKNNCRKSECLAYRIDQIITAYDIEISEINIDDFFEEGNKNQMTIFDIMENQK